MIQLDQNTGSGLCSTSAEMIQVDRLNDVPWMSLLKQDKKMNFGLYEERKKEFGLVNEIEPQR